MEGRYLRESEPTPVQPGVLDVGIFVVCSSSHSGRTHWVSVSVVPKAGPHMVAGPFSWKTTGIPEELQDEITDLVSALWEEESTRRFGVAMKLPE